MEQSQLCLLMVVFVLNIYFGDSYKITGYDELAVHPLEKRSPLTEFNHDLSDSSMRTSSSLANINSIKGFNEKQSKGLFDSLLGGLGSGGGRPSGGGSPNGGGSQSGSGVQVGGGNNEGNKEGSGSGGRGGGLLGGVGGLLSGLLSPVLSILGLSRRSNEEMENSRMIHKSSNCGNNCGGEASALESPMLDNDDLGDSESIGFRKSEAGKASNDADNLVDLDSSILSSRSNIYKDSGIQSDSNTRKKIGHIAKSRLKRQLGDGGSLADETISVLESEKLSSGNNVEDDSVPPTTNEQKRLSRFTKYKESKSSSGEGDIDDLKRRKLQMQTNQRSVEENEQESLKITKGLSPIKKNKEEKANFNSEIKSIEETYKSSILNMENKEMENQDGLYVKKREKTISKEKMKSTKGLKSKEETRESEVIKEISDTDSLETEENNTKYSVEKKLAKENGLYVTYKERVLRTEFESRGGSKLKEETSVTMQEMKNADSLENDRSIETVVNEKMDQTYGTKTEDMGGSVADKEISNTAMESDDMSRDNLEYKDIENVIKKSKHSGKKEIHTNSRESRGKGCKEEGTEEMYSTSSKVSAEINKVSLASPEKKETYYNDMSIKHVETKEIDYREEINSGVKSRKYLKSKEVDNTNTMETSGKSSEKGESKKINIKDITELVVLSNEGVEEKEVDNIDRIESDGQPIGNEGRRELDNKERTESGNINSKYIENKEIDNMDDIDSGAKTSENEGNRGMDNKMRTEYNDESIGSGDKSRENEGMRDMVNKDRTGSEVLSRENLEKKDLGNRHDINQGRENEGSKEMYNKGRTESEAKDTDIFKIKEIDIIDNIKSGSKSCKNDGKVEMNNKERTETKVIRSENAGYKEMAFEERKEMDDKDRTELGAMSIENLEKKEMNNISDNKGKREIVNEERIESEVMSSENVKNKEISTGSKNLGSKEVDSTNTNDPVDATSEQITNKGISNTENLETENNSGENVESTEVRFTDPEERDGISSNDPDIKETDISMGSDNRKPSSTESEEFRSDSVEENDDSENVVDKGTSSSADSNSDGLGDDESNRRLESRIPVEDNSVMDRDSKDSKESESSSTSIEDFTNNKEIYSSESNSNYADYSYFEYDFSRENPKYSDSEVSENEKSDDSSNAGNESTESVINTEKYGRYRYHISFPYNSAHIYSDDIPRMYRPRRYRYHPRSLFFRGQLSNAPFKRSIPPAQAKQFETPFLSRYPSSMASSDLFGSYAVAHNRPSFSGGEGLGGESILGQEIAEQEAGGFGR